jgi:hypothetical protein
MSRRARRAGLLWTIWDGAAYSVTTSLLHSGRLLNLRRLIGGGTLASLTPPSPNCQTPPSLASLLTGVDGPEHGIVSYRIPGPAPWSTDSVVGFEQTLAAAPIWEVAATGGGRSVLVHLPWAFRRDGTAPPGIDYAAEAYSQRMFGPQVVEVPTGASMTLGRADGTRVAPPFEVTVSRDGESVLARWGRSRRRLRASAVNEMAWRPLHGSGELGTYVSAWRVDGGVRFVHTGCWRVRRHDPHRAVARGEPFVGSTLGDAYRAGALGPREAGAPGLQADRVFAASLELQARSFSREAIRALRAYPGRELAIAYQPVIDEAQHELFRWWGDPGPGSGCRLRDRAQALMVRAYELADEQLGRAMEVCSEDTTFVVSSDHGFCAVDRAFHVNQALADAGLLVFDGHGDIDLAATEVFFHPARSGAIFARPDLLLSPQSAESLLSRASAALLAARDPQDSRCPTHRLRAANRRGPERRPDPLGDLFIEGAPGFDLRSERGPDGATFSGTAKGGNHVANNGAPSLQGILAIGGGVGRTPPIPANLHNRHVFALVAGRLDRTTAGAS